MKLIIEGVDGVGKTTLVRQIADRLECDILSMTRCGSKKISDYLAKAELKHIMSDRSFISEVVYSTVFNRRSAVTPRVGEILMSVYQALGWKFYLLDAEPETIRERLILRGDEDPINIENVDRLREAYLGFARTYSIPVIKSEELDIENFIAELKG